MTENVRVQDRGALCDLLAEINSIDPELSPPAQDFDEQTDSLIAVITDNHIKRIFSLANTVKREVAHMQLDAQIDSDIARRDLALINELMLKAKLLTDLAYYELRVLYKQFNVSSIGIRRGWRLVSRTEQRSFRSLFEGLK